MVDECEETVATGITVANIKLPPILACRPTSLVVPSGDAVHYQRHFSIVDKVDNIIVSLESECPTQVCNLELQHPMTLLSNR